MLTYDEDNELVDDHPQHQALIPVLLHGAVCYHYHLCISCIPGNVWIHVCNDCYEWEGGQVLHSQEGDDGGWGHGGGGRWS